MKNPWVSELTKLLKGAAKKPGRAHSELYRAFVMLAVANEREAAGAVLERLEAEGPAKMSPSAFYEGTLGAFRGKPNAAQEATVRQRLTMNGFAGKPPSSDSFRQKAADDPWRRIDHWRWIQVLAARGDVAQATALLDEYLAALPESERGAGYGQEFLLALSLALRANQTARAAELSSRYGQRLFRAHQLEPALCLPEVAAAISKGLLRETAGFSAADVKAAMALLPGAATKKAKVPSVQKRKVSAEYSQVQLEPETRTPAEVKQVVFQKKGDSERGMSLFPTMVGLATPSETEAIEAEVTVAEKPAAAKGAVQEVAFPLEVRGPLVLRSATSADGDDEPLQVPPGAYDVLARFFLKKLHKASGLRTFKLTLEFLPSGKLKAPKTIRLEGA